MPFDDVSALRRLRDLYAAQLAAPGYEPGSPYGYEEAPDQIWNTPPSVIDEPPAQVYQSGGKVAQSLARKVVSALVPDADPALGTYLRFGKWPENERSYNFITGGHERGVSAYELGLDGAINPGKWGSEALDRRRLEHLFPEDHRGESVPQFVIQGRRAGYGEDGEPVLRDIRDLGIGYHRPYRPAPAPYDGQFASGGLVDYMGGPDEEDYGYGRMTRTPAERRNVREQRIAQHQLPSPEDDWGAAEWDRFGSKHKFNPLSYGMEALGRLDSSGRDRNSFEDIRNGLGAGHYQQSGLLSDAFVDVGNLATLGLPTLARKAVANVAPMIFDAAQEFAPSLFGHDEKPQEYREGGVVDIIKAVRSKFGNTQGRRIEQAADLTNLERLSEKGIYDLFDPANRSNTGAGLLAAIPPEDFTKYAKPIPEFALDAVPYPRWHNVPRSQARGIPKDERGLDTYLDLLGNRIIDKGLETPAQLWLYRNMDPMTAVEGHEGRHRTMALGRLGEDRALVNLRPANAGELRGDIDERIERLQSKYFPRGRHELIVPEGLTDQESAMLADLPSRDRASAVERFGATRPPVPFYSEPFAGGGQVLERIAKHFAGKPKQARLPSGEMLDAYPIREFEDVASTFARRNGNELPQSYPTFDEDRARRIAEAYEAMKHDPFDPAVKRSYEALIDETMDQYKALEGTGAKFEFLRPGEADPYAASPALGYQDLIENGRLKVFPTDSGFGTLNDISDNPLLRRVGRVGDLEDATANDAFRVVHDALGHFGPGNPFFRHQGEERAWLNHRPTFSEDAVPAMTSETRGQNSWVNFGPHGEKNRKALGGDTTYADQKTGLLPPWAYEEQASPNLYRPQSIEELVRIARSQSRPVDTSHSADIIPFPSRGFKDGGPVAFQSRGHVAADLAKKAWKSQRAEDLKKEVLDLNRGHNKPSDPFVSPDVDKRLQTVTDPQRIMYPGIYKDPNDLVTDALRRFVPDPGKDGLMYRLFGHTRDSLDELSQGNRRFDSFRPTLGPASEQPFTPPAGGTGADVSDRVLTRRNANRLQEAIDAGLRNPQIRNTRSWYEMSPLWDHADTLGVPDTGPFSKRALNTRMGVMSPSAAPPVEVERGFLANYLAHEGRTEDFVRLGGVPLEERGDWFPPDMMDMTSHLRHRRAHVPNLLDFETTGRLWSPKHKVPTYVGATDPVWPNASRPIADAHLTRFSGYPDVRTSNTQATLKKELSNSEYSDFFPWFDKAVASPLDLRPRDAQALMWNLGGPQTGVRYIGPMKLEMISNFMGQSADRLGVSPEHARDMLLTGKTPGFAEGGTVEDDMALWGSQNYAEGGSVDSVDSDMLGYNSMYYAAGGVVPEARGFFR